MRPSVVGPTGTVIGAPVASARHPPPQPIGGAHGQAAHPVVPQVLLDLEDQRLVAPIQRHSDRVVDLGRSEPAGNSTSTTGPIICTILP